MAGARQENSADPPSDNGAAVNQLFNEYIYQSLSVTYPVLADLATLKGLLRETRQCLERTLTST